MAQLHILSGKRQGDTFELRSGEEVDIGNRKSAKLSIRDPWVSYNHARIVSEASGRFVIEDQDSSNGTWLDAPSGPKRIKRHELNPNDVFALGKTRIKFVADVPALTTTSFGAGPGATKKLGADAPWWDKPQSDSGAVDGKAPDSKAAGSLEQQLREERKMREALEKFLELPPGSSKPTLAGGGGGVAQDEVDRMRRDLMSKQVELESRAQAAEAKAIELERKLSDKSDQTKRELSRTKEKLAAEVEELKAALEEAKKSASALAAGGGEALESERQRGDKLDKELADWREKTRQAEDQVEHWKREHAAVIQEIDDISMEQIEIEDGLKTRIRELEAKLSAQGTAPSALGIAPPEEKKTGTGKFQMPAKAEPSDVGRSDVAKSDSGKKTGRPKDASGEGKAMVIAPTITPSKESEAEARRRRDIELLGDASNERKVKQSTRIVPEAEPSNDVTQHAASVARLDNEALGILPSGGELSSRPSSYADDLDPEGSADLTPDE